MLSAARNDLEPCDRVELGEVPCVRLLRMRDVEEPDTADEHHGSEWLPLFRRPAAPRFELLPHRDHRLPVARLLRDALSGGHFGDQVRVVVEDEVDVAIALELELRDLRRHTPDTPAEIARAGPRRPVRLRKSVDRVDSCVLRMQDHELPLWVAQSFQPSETEVAASVAVLWARRDGGGSNCG